VNDALLQSFKRVELEDATLLGVPLFVGAALDSPWENRCEDLARACDRLHLIGAQDALILLRSSFSAPKDLHLLHYSPSANHQALSNFDAILSRAIQLITNSNFSELQWI